MFQKELRNLRVNLTSNLMIMKEKRSFQQWRIRQKNIMNSKKEKKFKYLRYKPKTQNTSEIDELSDQPETPTSEHQKLLSSPVLKRKTTQIFDKNLTNKTLLKTITTTLSKPY